MKRTVAAALDDWLRAPDRKPLVLRGARQVGKTRLVRDLAARSGRELAEINFERDPSFARYFRTNDAAAIVGELSLALDRDISPGRRRLQHRGEPRCFRAGGDHVLSLLSTKEAPVAQLIVRDLDPELVVELRRRAAESGRSAEAEHRELLRSVLKPGRKRTPLKSLLLAMPAVGEDADFARGRSRARAVRL